MPPESAPPGKGLIGLLLYSDWAAPRFDQTDGEILGASSPTSDASSPASLTSSSSPAALNAVPGTHKKIAEIERLTDPRDPVQLAGDCRVMPSVNGSIVSGEIAAEHLATTLGR